MATQETGKTRLVLTWVLRFIVGLLFLGIGIEKLTGTEGTIPFLPPSDGDNGSAIFTGAWDVAGALLIFAPRWTSLGALMITCSVGLGTVLCYTKALFNPAVPLAMTLLAAILIGLAWRPKADA
jgi:hypothetical protein